MVWNVSACYSTRAVLTPLWGFLTVTPCITSLLSYGSNRTQGLFGLEGLTGDGKSNSTLRLCGKPESEPESDWALPATGGRKYDGVWGRSLPSACLSASWASGSCLWWWRPCPPWCWGSCIMFSTSESSEWLEGWREAKVVGGREGWRGKQEKKKYGGGKRGTVEHQCRGGGMEIQRVESFRKST